MVTWHSGNKSTSFSLSPSLGLIIALFHLGGRPPPFPSEEQQNAKQLGSDLKNKFKKLLSSGEGG